MPVLTKDSQETQKLLSKLVAKAWLDEGFKQRFISEPTTVLEENGVTLSTDIDVRVNENTSFSTPTNTIVSQNSNGIYEIVLPPKPAQLTDEQFQSLASGEGSRACF